MKLGILKALKPADDADIPGYGNETERFVQFFAQVDAPFEYEVYEITQGQFPPSPQACDAYLITGSVSGVYDDEPWIPQLMAFIQSTYLARQKMVGICFGHQVLAHSLGGRAEKSSKGWGLGLREFSINQPKPWMVRPPGLMQLNFAHQDQVVALPVEAELLGSSEFCPHAVFCMGDQVLGMQGHPEITNPFMADIVNFVAAEVDETVSQEAAVSLTQGEPDSSLMAQWIVNFLQPSAK